MAASTNSHLGFNGLPSRLWAAEPTYAPSKDACQSLREMARSEENRRSWLSHLVRSGVLFVILLEIGGVLGLGTAAHAATIFPFEIFNIAAGATCLYITWTVWFHYNWRLVMLGFSGLVIAGASYLSLSTGQTEPLFISVDTPFGHRRLTDTVARSLAGSPHLPVSFVVRHQCGLLGNPI